jgi:hypothetical protein
MALCNPAVMHQARGETARAVACLEEALVIAREMGNHYMVCNNLINLSVARGVAGDHEAAAAGWRDAIAQAQAHGLHFHVTHSHGGLAGAMLTLGRLDESHAEARLALDAARTGGHHLLVIWMLCLLARVDIARMRFGPAIATLREAVQVGRRHGLQVDLLRTARHYAMARAGQGHRLEAARMLRAVLSHPLLPTDAAQAYAPDLDGLHLTADEQHSLNDTPSLTLSEVLAQIEGDTTRG